MWISFYKIEEDARNDFRELCPKSVEKIERKFKGKSEDVINTEINRKIRRCCNLGAEVGNPESNIQVKQYFDLLFVVSDYKVLYIYKDTELEPYIISETKKKTYNWLERKLTEQRKSEGQNK